MGIVKTLVSIEDIDAPSPLYKYRDWDNKLHRTIISERVVYFAPPSSFEDEKEFRNYIRYDLLTDKEIYEKYLKLSHVYNTGFSREQHRAYARSMMKKAPFKNTKYLRETQEAQYKEYDERVGILSLTEYNDSLEMWNYYANKGKGFCVGFDTHILFNYVGSGAEVLYPPEGLPMIHATDSPDIELWKQAFNKDLKWEFEREYRVTIFNIDGLSINKRRVQQPAESFKVIVFGWDMPNSSKESIRKVCDASGLNIIFYQAIKRNNSISVEVIS